MQQKKYKYDNRYFFSISDKDINRKFRDYIDKNFVDISKLLENLVIRYIDEQKIDKKD